MKRLNFSLVLIAVALLLAASATAGLGNITLARGVSAGIVRTDTDAGVAIKFTALSPYTSYMTINAVSGEVAFSLAKAMLSLSGNRWSANNTFTIGSSSSGFFTITNNSGGEIRVTLVNATGGLDLIQVNSDTILPGSSDTFYFSIDSTGQTKTTIVSGSIQIRNAL